MPGLFDFFFGPRRPPTPPPTLATVFPSAPVSDTKNFLDFLKGRGVDYGRPQTEKDEREFGGKSDLDAFLEGKLVLLVQSSFVRYARYNPYLEAMEFGYATSPHVAVFTDFPLVLARSFASAPSKGRWYHRSLKAGYNADGTWIHVLPYYPGKTLRDFIGPVIGRPE